LYALKAEEEENAGVPVAASPGYRQACACLYGNERRLPLRFQSDILH
jgi:hypothetical protein